MLNFTESESVRAHRRNLAIVDDQITRLESLSKGDGDWLANLNRMEKLVKYRERLAKNLAQAVAESSLTLEQWGEFAEAIIVITAEILKENLPQYLKAQYLKDWESGCWRFFVDTIAAKVATELTGKPYAKQPGIETFLD